MLQGRNFESCKVGQLYQRLSLLISSPVAVSATISVDDSSMQACKSIGDLPLIVYEEAVLDSMIQSWASGMKINDGIKKANLRRYRKLNRRRLYLY